MDNWVSWVGCCHRVPAEWKRGDHIEILTWVILWRACCVHLYCAHKLVVQCVCAPTLQCKHCVCVGQDRVVRNCCDEHVDHCLAWVRRLRGAILSHTKELFVSLQMLSRVRWTGVLTLLDSQLLRTQIPDSSLTFALSISTSTHNSTWYSLSLYSIISIYYIIIYYVLLYIIIIIIIILYLYFIYLVFYQYDIIALCESQTRVRAHFVQIECLETDRTRRRYLSLSLSLYIYIYIYTHMYIYMYICVDVYIHVYIYIYREREI